MSQLQRLAAAVLPNKGHEQILQDADSISGKKKQQYLRQERKQKQHI
jgi:hypothetical protein